MKNIISSFFIMIVSIVTYSCNKEEGPQPAAPSQDFSFTEEFDSVGDLSKKGWVIRNNSKPGGFSQWTQGYNYFPAFSSTWNAFDYAACDFFASGVPSTLSVWMITAPIPVKNGDIISFYTRTTPPVRYPDRLQFRFNSFDDGANVGNDSSSLGNFTTLIFDINPNLLATGATSYPTTWTKYQWVVTGMPNISLAVKRRFAFRYYVKDGGGGNNSNYIGVDKMEFKSVPK